MFAHSAQRVLVLSLVLSACLSWASIIDRNLVNATTQDLSTDQQSIRDSRYSSDFDFDADPSSTMAEPAEPEEEFDGNVFLDGEALGRAQAKHPQASPSGDHPEPKPTDSFGLPPLLRPEPDQGSGNNKTCPRKRSMVSDPMHLYFAPYVPITTKDNPFLPNYSAIMANDMPDQELKSEACPSYRTERHRLPPMGLQGWWNRQKKMDHGKMQLKIQPRYQDPPRFLVYDCCADSGSTLALPTPQQLAGVNVLVLAFLTGVMPDGYLTKFYQLSPQQRMQWLNSMHEAGISVMVSTFGGDPQVQPVKMGYDPTAIGKLHGEIIRESGFDGLDFDDEDFERVESQYGHAVTTWTIRYLQAVRKELPQGKYMVSAVPVAPWFTTNTEIYCSGLYRTIHKVVGKTIDWYGLQFYNQGPGTYEDCDSILFNSKLPGLPNASIFQIAKSTGMSPDKLVIGKPSQAQEDAANGFIPMERLAQCVSQAKAKGWKGGVFLWEYRPGIAGKFATIRGKSFPPEAQHPNPKHPHSSVVKSSAAAHPTPGGNDDDCPEEEDEEDL